MMINNSLIDDTGSGLTLVLTDSLQPLTYFPTTFAVDLPDEVGCGDVLQLVPLVTHQQKFGLLQKLHDHLEGLPKGPEVLKKVIFITHQTSPHSLRV